jgi:hypothetical protein
VVIKNLKIIAKNINKMGVYIGSIEVKAKQKVKINDIKLPKNIKIINSNKTLFTVNTKNCKVKILLKINLRSK